MFVSKLFAILVGIYIVGYAAYIMYYAVGLYHLNPFIKLKPLTPSEKLFISEQFSVYNTLSEKLKSRYHERIIWFRSRKKFVFYGNVENQEDIKLIVSATAILMTLGMKQYRMTDALMRIVVYPSQYYSRINKKHHLGEYNPRLKLIVFAADTLWEGFKTTKDNRNLAVHELAHALSFEMLGRNTWEARRFKIGFKKMKRYCSTEDFARRLQETAYFREYGMTNIYEFFSVAVENYIETPHVFSKEFPELYTIIKGILHFNFRK